MLRGASDMGDNYRTRRKERPRHRSADPAPGPGDDDRLAFEERLVEPVCHDPLP